MGDLIALDTWRADRLRPTSESRPDPETRPIFCFDLACPLSYLVAERIERSVGDARWVAVALTSVRGDRSARELSAVRRRAEADARGLRLPLVWPDRFPAPTPRALRAAAHAAEIGTGARFALAASRLAFCGGFDLEDPETLAEAAAAAAVPLDECLRAASDPGRDESLRATAHDLRGCGVKELPVLGIGGRWFEGAAGLVAASAMLRPPASYGGPLAPVG